MDTNQITEIIRSRRSIFPPMYSDKEITKETILQILENANWAPNHKKTEPWRFKIYRKESLQSLSEYLGGYYKEHTTEDKFSQKKYEKTLAKPLQSSCVIAICMYNNPDVNIPEWEELAAVACAVQNMWLSCVPLGIGAYWSSPKSIIEADKFLGLGEHEKCLGLFYMGYTKEGITIPGSRGDIAEKIEWK